jgi:hypothetical protein
MIPRAMLSKQFIASLSFSHMHPTRDKSNLANEARISLKQGGVPCYDLSCSAKSALCCLTRRIKCRGCCVRTCTAQPSHERHSFLEHKSVDAFRWAIEWTVVV